jgi:preprotein translocase subunit Sss1
MTKLDMALYAIVIGVVVVGVVGFIIAVRKDDDK